MKNIKTKSKTKVQGWYVQPLKHTASHKERLEAIQALEVGENSTSGQKPHPYPELDCHDHRPFHFHASFHLKVLIHPIHK